jgi:hypothetical protein
MSDKTDKTDSDASQLIPADWLSAAARSDGKSETGKDAFASVHCEAAMRQLENVMGFHLKQATSAEKISKNDLAKLQKIQTFLQRLIIVYPGYKELETLLEAVSIFITTISSAHNEATPSDNESSVDNDNSKLTNK